MGFIYMLLLGVIYLIIELFLRKKLKTNRKSGFLRIFKGRNKIFLTVEIVILISFLVLIFFKPPVFSVFGPFVFLFILFLLRGLEEWVFRRHEKEYYHSWLGASFFLLAFIISFITFG
ncbi:DUF4181 domain-containing protein [Cytobacillus oceanisediminis]|uniref:DUF4181 domain-containing protein n=1 Tax=Cytobacillus oceanisediminis TaxID=665099 RepID=UPI003735DEDE